MQLWSWHPPTERPFTIRPLLIFLVLSSAIFLHASSLATLHGVPSVHQCTCCSFCLACTPQLAQVPHPTFLSFLLTHRLLTPLTIASIKPSRETAFMCLNPTLDCKLPGGQDLRLLFYSFIKGTSYMDSTPYTLTAGIHEINTRLSHLYKQTSD